MRPDIKFASFRSEAPSNSAHPLFTFCSRLFTFVHDKKSSLEIRLCILTPERMSGRPVDNSRLPKLRAISTLQHGFRASNTRKPSAISTFSIPKAPKRPPFQWFSTRYSLLHLVTPKFFENAKPSAIPTVPFCSALFRQKNDRTVAAIEPRQ